MLPIKFRRVTIPTTSGDQLHITGGWATNGHWLINISEAPSAHFEQVRYLPDGVYSMGARAGDAINIESLKRQFIENLENYERAEIGLKGRLMVRESRSARALHLATVEIEVRGEVRALVQAPYAGILLFGDEILVKDSSSVILVRKQGQVIAGIMPYKMEAK